MVPRHVQVGQDQVVVRDTADAQGLDRQRHAGRRAAVDAGQQISGDGRASGGRGPRLGRQLGLTGGLGLTERFGLAGGRGRDRGGLGHAAQHRAVVGIAQVHDAVHGDREPVDALRSDEGPVGAAGVLENPRGRRRAAARRAATRHANLPPRCRPWDRARCGRWCRRAGCAPRSGSARPGPACRGRSPRRRPAAPRPARPARTQGAAAGLASRDARGACLQSVEGLALNGNRLNNAEPTARFGPSGRRHA